MKGYLYTPILCKNILRCMRGYSEIVGHEYSAQWANPFHDNKSNSKISITLPLLPIKMSILIAITAVSKLYHY